MIIDNTEIFNKLQKTLQGLRVDFEIKQHKNSSSCKVLACKNVHLEDVVIIINNRGFIFSGVTAGNLQKNSFEEIDNVLIHNEIY